jgi:disulfide bond formation protein DsbB
MDVQTVAHGFALILLCGAIALLAALTMPRYRDLVRQFGLTIAAAVAVGATSGSLYFSEVAGFDPCEMCWVQRIFMYPLAIILSMAAIRRHRGIIPYAMVLATIGLGFSAYHVQLQLRPDQSTSCDPFNPCSAKWVEALGFATIPQMAGLSFILILVSLAAHLRSS